VTARYFVTDGFVSFAKGALCSEWPLTDRIEAEEEAREKWRTFRGAARPHIHVVVNGIVTEIDVWHPSDEDLLWLVEMKLRGEVSPLPRNGRSK